MSSRTELDTRGLLCPLPVIRTQDAIKRLDPGDEVAVTATDPGAMHDIPAWCRVHGHDLITSEARESTYHFLIRVCR